MKKKLISTITLASLLICLAAYSNINKNYANNLTTPNKTNVSLLANTSTSKTAFEKGYHDYAGVIGKTMPIKMSIYKLDNDIVGTYYYDSQRKDIKLKGTLTNKNLVLYEYDLVGKNTGVFKGTMNTADQIEGTWISGDKKKSYPFTLSLTSFLPGSEYGKRYAVAVGRVSDQSVESFANTIQSYISNNNKKLLAESIDYPINVKIDNKIIKIQNKDAFINNYDKIFYQNFKKELINTYAKNMFANYKGVMFGADTHNLWINAIISKNGTAKLMITTINN